MATDPDCVRRLRELVENGAVPPESLRAELTVVAADVLREYDRILFTLDTERACQRDRDRLRNDEASAYRRAAETLRAECADLRAELARVERDAADVRGRAAYAVGADSLLSEARAEIARLHDVLRATARACTLPEDTAPAALPAQVEACIRDLSGQIEQLTAERDRLQRACDEGLPREVIHCPACGRRHLDGANGVEFATKPHHTHLCQHCGHIWDHGRWSFGADVPAPVRYRRVSLYGHVSLGVCRIEDVEVAGVKMIRATTLCAAIPRVAEFPGTSVYVLHVLSAEEALAEAAGAAERRAAQARAEEENRAREASARARRAEDRAHAVVTVTVAGDHVELRPTYDGLRAPHLLDFAHAEVGAAFAAQGLNPFYVPHLKDREELPGGGGELRHVGARLDGFGPSVADVVQAVAALGFREVVHLPDQPARAEDEDIPFDDAAAVAHYDEPSDGSEPGGGA